MTLEQRRLTAIAKGQLGVVTREQARAAGFSDYQLRHRVQSGVLEQVGPNAFRLPSAQRTHAEQLAELMLDIGGEVWVAGPSAAALFGFDGFALEPPFHVTIKRGRDVHRVGHKVHTTKVLLPGDEVEWGGFRTFKPTRTLLDLARMVPIDRLTIAVESALRDRWVTEAGLRRRVLSASPIGRFGTRNLLAVLDERDRKLGAHSFLERAFLEAVERSGLPRPDTQQVLSRARDRVVRVDFRFAGTPLVVEVLGYRFHRSKHDMQRDVERVNALVIDGFLPLQFTYEDVIEREAEILATVRAALAPYLAASA
jgi:very-short-patch-repair endonuclease